MRTLIKHTPACVGIVLSITNIVNAQWSNEINLTNNSHPQQTWWLPAITASGNSLHVIIFDAQFGTHGELAYTRSNDLGQNWEPIQALTNNNTPKSNQSISSYENFIYVVWLEDRNNTRDIFLKRSTDGGSTWESDQKITNNTPPFQPVAWPSVSCSGSNVVVIWYDNRTGAKLYTRQSSDYGATWQPEAVLVSNNQGVPFPYIVQNDLSIYAVWIDQRHANPELYFKYSHNNGTSWSADFRLTQSSGNFIDKNYFYPILSVQDSLVCLVWTDKRDGNNEIYFRISTNGGLSWGVATRLTNDGSQSNWPKVIIADSNIHVLWSDSRPGHMEIYYKSSPDYGITWSDDERLTTGSSLNFSSIIPSITIANESVNVIWNKSISGNAEIFYKRNPDFDPSNVDNDRGSTLSHFYLEQNYPNPFNPITKINWQSPLTSHQTLKVYDMLGNEVATLVDEYKEAGSYEVEFDASNISSGIYFYKLQAGSFIEIKKMTLLK